MGWYKNIVHNWANKPQFILVAHPPCKNGRRQKLGCSIYGCDVNIGLVFSVQPGEAKIKLHLTQSTNAAINRYLIHAKRTNWNHFQWMVGWLVRVFQRNLNLLPRQFQQFAQWISGKLYYFCLKMFSMIIAEILTPFKSNFFCKLEGYCT